MIAEILLILSPFLFAPFLIAQYIPSLKWLFSFSVIFLSLAIWQYFDAQNAIATGHEGNGFAECLGTLFYYSMCLSGSIGVATRGVTLFLKSKQHRFKIRMAVVYIAALLL